MTTKTRKPSSRRKPAVPKQQIVSHPHLAPMRLLPPKPGVCAECAVDHEPGAPHNQQSLAYQYDFYGKHGRWPTWSDAMAHCESSLQKKWKAELKKLGVKVDG